MSHFVYCCLFVYAISENTSSCRLNLDCDSNDPHSFQPSLMTLSKKGRAHLNPNRQFKSGLIIKDHCTH